MKFRKGLLAAATATAVTATGVVAAPAFSEEKTEKPQTTSTVVTTTVYAKSPEEVAFEREKWLAEEKKKEALANAKTGDKIKRQFVEGSTDSNGNLDPKAITAWIAVFTAALGAIGTLISFLEKNFNIKFY